MLLRPIKINGLLIFISNDINFQFNSGLYEIHIHLPVHYEPLEEIIHIKICR
jgi:hypothetical protein